MVALIESQMTNNKDSMLFPINGWINLTGIVLSLRVRATIVNSRLSQSITHSLMSCQLQKTIVTPFVQLSIAQASSLSLIGAAIWLGVLRGNSVFHAISQSNTLCAPMVRMAESGGNR